MPAREAAALLSALGAYSAAYSHNPDFKDIVADCSRLAEKVHDKATSGKSGESPGRRVAASARSSGGHEPPMEAARARFGIGPAKRQRGYSR